MRKVLMFLFAMCLALFAVSAMAQTSTTGSIEGTVLDPQGNAVPNAEITISGANLISPQTTQTDTSGRYKVLNLPPGKYTIAVSATAGFKEAKKDNVEVNLSKTTTADVNVEIAGQAATVTVTDTSGAAVDVTNNTTGNNVSSDQFSNFPTARTVQGLYTIAPTVTRSGLRDASGRDRDPSVAGSSGPENNYILDGVNTTDPAFGGSGANLPFEFVQEVEIKTGAYGAEFGRATGGIFNVITKSGGNEFHGDAFGYFTTKGLVRDVKDTAVPFTGAAPTAFSEIDAGGDIGGPISKDKLWFFGAFNPQRRQNYFSTQTLHQAVDNKITTPFYAGKLTWAVNRANTLTFSTFGDFTKQEGFLFRVNARVPDSGFGADLNSFNGIIETGGHNYTARLNSSITPTWIGEFMGALHFQRANTLPNGAQGSNSQITDLYSVVTTSGVVRPVTNTTTVTGGLQNAFVDGRGGTLVRNFVRQGFGLISDQDRDRFEIAARFTNIYGRHTIKYGFEWNENKYKIFTRSSGPARTFTDPLGEELIDSLGRVVPASHKATNMPGGVRITNRFGICAAVSATAVQCPSSSLTPRVQAMITAGQGPAGITTVTTNTALTDAQLNANPILVLASVRVRDFLLNTGDNSTSTRVESFYVQDDFKISKDVQFNFGLRWDYQQSYGTDSTYLRFNNFKDNLQPRVGLIWDFTGRGRGKVFVNYARFLETPIPLDVNVRAGGDDIQMDKNINASALNAPPGSSILAGAASGLGCLGCEPTPVDRLLIQDPAGNIVQKVVSNYLKPQTVNEATAGIEFETGRGFTLGFRGIYRTQGSVIEDGSLDDGTTYFLFNPGETFSGKTTIENLACDPNTISPVLGAPVGCFGRARRYYRALEFTATKRFTQNWQMIASYVYSSLIGNYEGLFRNDNGQSDPNITSLFDLPELLPNTYGRLPNDKPHQFKVNGSYRTPWKLLVSGNFYAQSGMPFNSLVPHPIYGENEGFGVPRGTAINPTTGDNRSPSTFQLDLGAYYPIKVGENKELRLQMDWFNVTNAQRAIQEDQTVRFSSGIPGASETRFLNPFFGTGTVFQFPSAWRFGAKFSF